MLTRVAELADAHDSGSCWRQYGFKSLLSHQYTIACGRGGIGRRVRLRGVWLTRVSSSLIDHTKKQPKIRLFFLFIKVYA